jgi:hypothetical protein
MGKIAGFDHNSMADAFVHPGIDPRQHISYALVDKGDENNPSVIFDEEYGQVLVNITLQPSGLSVRARVASGVAGNGEGEYFPFMENDEVMVVIPNGNERAGVCIIGRMGNKFDAFPRSVAGQDATKNTFGFRRMRTPYILETASSYMIRSAVSGSFISIDTAGSLTVSDGNANMLHVGADFIGFGSGDNSTLFQLDLHKNQIVCEANGTKLVLDGDDSTFNSSGTLSLGTSGGFPTGHGVTLEQVVNLIINLLYTMLSSCTGPFPACLTTGATAPFSTIPGAFPASLVTFVQTWLTMASSPIPPTPVLGGGVFLPGLPQIIQLAMMTSAPLSGLDPTGLVPGVGRPGLKL